MPPSFLCGHRGYNECQVLPREYPNNSRGLVCVRISTQLEEEGGPDAEWGTLRTQSRIISQKTRDGGLLSPRILATLVPDLNPGLLGVVAVESVTNSRKHPYIQALEAIIEKTCGTVLEASKISQGRAKFMDRIAKV